MPKLVNKSVKRFINAQGVFDRISRHRRVCLWHEQDVNLIQTLIFSESRRYQFQNKGLPQIYPPQEKSVGNTKSFFPPEADLPMA